MDKVKVGDYLLLAVGERFRIAEFYIDHPKTEAGGWGAPVAWVAVVPVDADGYMTGRALHWRLDSVVAMLASGGAIVTDPPTGAPAPAQTVEEIEIQAVGPEGEGVPPTQLHLFIRVNTEGGFTIRFHSRPALDAFKRALYQVADYVWPVGDAGREGLN